MKHVLIPAVFAIALPGHAAESLSIKETDATIVIARGKTPILTYHKAEVPPPKGASPLYKRSGFLHPVHAPSGGVVTSIHAPDHVHHMGIWHAWVNTQHNGRKLDFWNLKKGNATIGYAKTLDIRSDGDVVGFKVLQHHSALSDGKKETGEIRFDGDTMIIEKDGKGLAFKKK